MKRLFIFIGAFLGVALVVFGTIFGLGWEAFETVSKNRAGLAEGSEWVEKTYSLKGLTDYIGANPQHVSVVSFNVNDPDSGIFYNANTPRTMGALQNILLLIEYERQVEQGIINPNEQIPLSDLDVFVLPKMNETIHKTTLSHLNLSKTDDIKLDDLVAAIIQHNDLVMADWLFFYLDRESPHFGWLWNDLLQELHTTGTHIPEPFIGTYITIQQEEVGMVLDTTLSIYKANAESYINNADFRDKIYSAFKEDYIGLDFQQERDALRWFPKTTANDFANIMAQIQREEVINSAASKRIKEKLSWANNSSTIKRSFTDYGAVYDNRMGVLSGIDFGTSIYDSHTSAQAVFFDSLQIAFWLHMSANHMQEDYQQRLIWDPALFETTLEAIEKGGADE